MSDQNRTWIERFAPVIALIFTVITLTFSAGVAWSVSQAREYVNQRIDELNKDTNAKYERILLELGKLQGKDEERKSRRGG